MSYYKKKRIRLVVSILISLLFLIVPITAYLYVTTAEQYAYDLVCNCSGISELDSYVTYNMLSGDLKKYIKKGDLNFSSVENIVELAKKIDSINYDYETSNKYIRSSGSFKQNPLSQYFDYNNKRYAIEFDIYFKPKLFSIKPKIVDWNVLMYEVNINWKTILRDEVRLGNDQHCVKIEIISDKVIEYREESECISSAEFAEEILKPVGITVKKENVVCRERYITVSAEISTEQLAEICAMESVVDVLGKVGEPYPTEEPTSEPTSAPSAIPTFAPDFGPETGDVNCDFTIDVTDLSELSLALIGDRKLSEAQQKAADVDKDGKVTLSDLARMRQYLSKVITSFG